MNFVQELFQVFSEKYVWIIIGQIFIISGLVATICIVVRELRKKPYSFWYIMINRLKFIFKIGLFRFLRMKALNREIPDHPYNYSYLWLRSNKVFIAYQLFVYATLDVIYQMINQISTGYVFNKPKDFFISSPIRSMCIFYIFWFLIKSGSMWKRRYFELLKKTGHLIDKDHKIDNLI